jgi:hypothetical protein
MNKRLDGEICLENKFMIKRVIELQWLFNHPLNLILWFYYCVIADNTEYPESLPFWS